MLVLDGNVMAVVKELDYFHVFGLHSNWLGMPDENGNAIVLKFNELDKFKNHLET